MNLKIFTVLVGALLAAASVQADGLTDEQQLFRALREQSAAIRQLPQNAATLPDVNALLQDKLSGADRQWICNAGCSRPLRRTARPVRMPCIFCHFPSPGRD